MKISPISYNYNNHRTEKSNKQPVFGIKLDDGDFRELVQVIGKRSGDSADKFVEGIRARSHEISEIIAKDVETALINVLNRSTAEVIISNGTATAKTPFCIEEKGVEGKGPIKWFIRKFLRADNSMSNNFVEALKTAIRNYNKALLIDEKALFTLKMVNEPPSQPPKPGKPSKPRSVQELLEDFEKNEK